MFDIFLTEEAEGQLNRLKFEKGLSKRYKAVKKAIQFLSQNPRHPGLQTHEVTSLKGSKGEKVFEAYAEQATPQHTEFSGITAPKKTRSPLSQ